MRCCCELYKDIIGHCLHLACRLCLGLTSSPALPHRLPLEFRLRFPSYAPLSPLFSLCLAFSHTYLNIRSSRMATSRNTACSACIKCRGIACSHVDFLSRSSQNPLCVPFHLCSSSPKFRRRFGATGAHPHLSRQGRSSLFSFTSSHSHIDSFSFCPSSLPCTRVTFPLLD